MTHDVRAVPARPLRLLPAILTDPALLRIAVLAVGVSALLLIVAAVL